MERDSFYLVMRLLTDTHVKTNVGEITVPLKKKEAGLIGMLAAFDSEENAHAFADPAGDEVFLFFRDERNKTDERQN